MSILTFDEKAFYLDNSPFTIIAGDVHYFRIPKTNWEHVLNLAVDFGLNTIQTYVPWNAHEPTPETYHFTGMLDLASFLSLCDKKNLKVLLRPGPYICSEWDLGGLPSWLLKDRDLTLRTSCRKYLSAVERYYKHLIPIFLPFLSTNGGPIIAVSIENEYGSYGNDHRYMDTLANMLRQSDVDVPLYTTDGGSVFCQTFGRGNNADFFGVNYRAMSGTSSGAEMVAKKLGKNQPFFIGEFWSGRSMHWGEPFYHRDPTETAIAFKEALQLGGNVCFYMFAGGSNFGFMGGADFGQSYSPRPGTPTRYIPHTTSYDVDALISEGGNPTEKYYLCRDVLDAFLGKEKRAHIYKARNTQSLSVELSETAPLFQNLDSLTEEKTFSLIPHPMEEYNQKYGLILYSTTIDAFEGQPKTIKPYKYRDRANIFIDDQWFATFLRDRGATKAATDVTLIGDLPAFTPNGLERKVDILVENIGRINHGIQLQEERKGLESPLLCGNINLYGYETRTIPLDDLSKLTWTKTPHSDHMPCFFKGTFSATAGGDSFVSFENFTRGYIWVNGFNIGRYDSAGPQITLYLPGEIVNQNDNEIIVLDIDPVGDKKHIPLLKHPVLEGDAAELS